WNGPSPPCRPGRARCWCCTTSKAGNTRRSPPNWAWRSAVPRPNCIARASCCARAWEDTMTDHELRWQLRQLPRDIEPARDLWPDIAARLQQAPVRRRRPWLAVLSLAACLCLAVGLAAMLRPAPTASPDLAAEL